MPNQIIEEIHGVVWRLAAAIWDCSKEKDTESSVDYQKRTENEMRIILEKALAQQRANFMNLPMGASQWEKHGLKYGYWNFFETEIRKDWRDEMVERVEKMKKEHLSDCIANQDGYGYKFRDCSQHCQANGYNSALSDIIKELNTPPLKK